MKFWCWHRNSHYVAARHREMATLLSCDAHVKAQRLEDLMRNQKAISGGNILTYWTVDDD